MFWWPGVILFRRLTTVLVQFTLRDDIIKQMIAVSIVFAVSFIASIAGRPYMKPPNQSTAASSPNQSKGYLRRIFGFLYDPNILNIITHILSIAIATSGRLFASEISDRTKEKLTISIHVSLVFTLVLAFLPILTISTRTSHVGGSQDMDNLSSSCENSSCKDSQKDAESPSAIDHTINTEDRPYSLLISRKYIKINDPKIKYTNFEVKRRTSHSYYQTDKKTV